MSVFSRDWFGVASESTHQTVVPLRLVVSGAAKSGSLVPAAGWAAVIPPPPYWMPIGWSLLRSCPRLVTRFAPIWPLVWLAPLQIPALKVALVVPEPGSFNTESIAWVPSWHDRQAIDTEPTGAVAPSMVAEFSVA